MLNRIKNQQGVALAWTIIILAVSVTLGFASITLAYSSSQESRRHEERVQAEFYAISAAEVVYHAIVENPDSLESLMNSKGHKSPISIQIDQGEAEVYLRKRP